MACAQYEVEVDVTVMLRVHEVIQSQAATDEKGNNVC